MASGELLTLLLKVEGGEASAAEISRVQGAMQGVEQENSALKERFQEGFQHVALKGFSTEAARSIGLGGELRPIIRLLNVGITELGESLGLAGSSAALLGTGFVALGAIAFVVYEHFKKHNENLAELRKKQEEALGSTVDLKDAFEKYGKVIGGLPENLKKVKQAVDDLAASQAEATRHTEMDTLAKVRGEIAGREIAIEGIRANIKELEREMSQMSASQRAHSQLAEQIKFLNEGIETFEKQNRDAANANEILTQNIIDQGKGAKGTREEISKLTEEATKNAEETKKAAEKSEAAWKKYVHEVLADIEKEEKAHEQLTERIKILQAEEAAATDNVQKKKEAEIQKFYIQQKAAIDREYKNEQDKALAVMALDRTVMAKRAENYSNVQLAAIKSSEAIAQGMGDAFAKTIVEGKDFETQMKALATNIAEGFISELIRVQIQALLTKAAVAGIFGGAPIPGAMPGYNG